MYQELEMYKQYKKEKMETLVLTPKSAEFLMRYHGVYTIEELGEKRNYKVVIKK